MRSRRLGELLASFSGLPLPRRLLASNHVLFSLMSPTERRRGQAKVHYRVTEEPGGEEIRGDDVVFATTGSGKSEAMLAAAEAEHQIGREVRRLRAYVAGLRATWLNG